MLVVAAHPDDEVFMAAGRARAALSAGDTVKVVVVTNGDANGVNTGVRRQGESVDSAVTIGLTESDVIFLGYGDGIVRQMYRSTSNTTVFTSSAGQTQTYASRGLGGVDYHTYLHGTPGSYTRATIAGDFRALVDNLRPDEIYTHSHFDAHSDHQAVHLFVVEAVLAVKRNGVPLGTKVYSSIVWMPHSTGHAAPWPQMSTSGWTPTLPIFPWSSPCTPGECLDRTQLSWKRVHHFVQPSEMRRTDPNTNMKALAVPGGITMQNGWYGAWVRPEEFFWLTDFGANLATSAQVSVSSQDSAVGRQATFAVDGIVGGLPSYSWPAREWVALSLNGAWIELAWPSAVRVSQVTLHDRVSTSENVLAGRLDFSDGSSVQVGALPANGGAFPVTFIPRDVTWVRFTVNSATGTGAGLSEIEVFGNAAPFTTNVPPHILEGPSALPETVSSGTASLSVDAWDIDADPLQYQWWAEQGSISGSGPSAVFTPPSVATATWIAVGVTVLDGRGGMATNVTFVQAEPVTEALVVTPTAVFGGDPLEGSVLLAEAAPAGGRVVTLSSSDPSIAAVPSSLTVPAGSSTETFAIQTSVVQSSAQVTISAALPSGTLSAPLSVEPRSVSALTVTPEAILTGGTATGTLELPLPAGPNGAVVGLSSSDPAVVTVPATVNVPPGATIRIFQITAAAAASASTVTITATYGTSKTATVQVFPPATVAGLALTPASVAGGVSVVATVQLAAPASAAGAIAEMLTSDPSLVSGASTVVFAPGATSATTVLDTAAVASPTSVTVAARSGASQATATLQILPPVLDGLSVTPTSVIGGVTATGTVTLGSPAPSSGTTVSLASSDPVAVVPASVTIPAGALEATFSIATGTPATTAVATIVATLGAVTRTATVSVTPPPASNANLLSNPEQIGAPPWSVHGTVTVSLNAATAPDGSQRATRVSTTARAHAVAQRLNQLSPGTYTFSFYAKNNGGTAAALSVYDWSLRRDIIAPLSYASSLNSATYTRVSVTFTVPSGSSKVGVYPIRDSGGPVDVLLWGAKLEVGGTATSYP